MEVSSLPGPADRIELKMVIQEPKMVMFSDPIKDDLTQTEVHPGHGSDHLKVHIYIYIYNKKKHRIYINTITTIFY